MGSTFASIPTTPNRDYTICEEDFREDETEYGRENMQSKMSNALTLRSPSKLSQSPFLPPMEKKNINPLLDEDL